MNKFSGSDTIINGSGLTSENDWSSQNRLSAIFTQATVGLSEISLEGRFLHVNDEICRILGRSREEVLLIGVPQVTHPEDVANSLSGFAEVVKKGGTISLDKRYVRPDGEIIRANSQLTRLDDEQGRARGVLAVTVDLTERWRAEDRLRQSEFMLANAQRIAQLGSWDWDIQKDQLLLSDELYRIFDLPKDKSEIALEDCLNKILPEDRGRVTATIKEALDNLAPYDIEYRIPQTDETARIVHAIGEVVFDITGVPLRMSGTVQDITDRKHAEDALRQSKERLSLAQEIANAGSFEWNLQTGKLVTSYQLEKICGASEDFGGEYENWLKFVHPDDVRVIERDVQKAIDEGEATGEFRIINAEGDVRWILSRLRAYYDAQGNPQQIIGVDMDITERKNAEDLFRKSEERFLQSQKLESVGRLAGGIAHDFNNMLIVINGYSDLSLQFLEEGNPLREFIQEIKKAGERSAAVTQQLLAFSRRQIMQPKVMCLNRIIRDTYNMLKRLIGEDVKLSTIFKNENSFVEIDPGQMTQVIMNLAVNARDAMPQGGTLSIKTENVNLNEKLSETFTLAHPGKYVKLSVSDTGAGMDETTKEHIFEPFYTTKGLGEGTGLGLATVYGVVKQSNGYIWVESEPGKGSTFTIYLPQVENTVTEENRRNLAPERRNEGMEVVMIVEDEDMVRALMRKILERSGYEIIEARNGGEALSICEQSNPRIDMLITDVVMPEMGGRELAEKLAARYPEMKILYTSGYTDDVVTRHGIMEDRVNFIQKPFATNALLQKARQVLNEKPSAR